MASKKKSPEIQFDAKSADAILTAMLAKKDDLRKKTFREIFAPLLPKAKALVEAGVPLETIAVHLSKDPATRISVSQLKGLLAPTKPIKGAAPNPSVPQRPTQKPLLTA